MVVVDVDAAWPSDVGVGCGLDLVKNLRLRKFPGVTVDYTSAAESRGSFEVTGIVRALTTLRDLEMNAFRKNEPQLPWWV